jgi:hypothetical protein
LIRPIQVSGDWNSPHRYKEVVREEFTCHWPREIRAGFSEGITRENLSKPEIRSGKKRPEVE